MCGKASTQVLVRAGKIIERESRTAEAPKKRKMSFASDKLYNGYLRRKMPTIASTVKVREIIVHLPCLTLHDRENIEAKRETYGNHDSMVLLLDCLRRRQNWPEQFIEALEACEHPSIAAEIRAEYNALRGVNNSNPSSPSTTVIRAHVHPAPSASHPENGGNTPAAVAPPAEASAPPQPAAQASPPLQTPVHPQAQSSAAHVPEAVPPPEPVPEPPQSTPSGVAPPTSTPPSSPETPHTPASTPPPQREVHAHQEPEENSESDIQDISVDNGVIPDQVSAGKSEASANSVVTPQQSRPVEQQETDTLSHPDPVRTAATEVKSPQSPSPTQANSDVTDGSSFLTLTPERPPVQDTAPPLSKTPAVVLEPEETSEPSTTQVIKSSPQRDAAAAASPLPGAAGMDTSAFEDNSMCLSKPGQLISIQPQNLDSPTIPAHNPPVEPYSGNSQRLEISDAASDAVSSAHVPVSPAVSGLSCQENGTGVNQNEPEENHYESPCQSLEVQMNVVHVSEEPSILNFDGQISAPQAQIINGEAAREITPPAPSSTTTAGTTLNTPSSVSCHPSEPAPAEVTAKPKRLPDSEEETASHALPTNIKYIVTAAGVGAIALLMAWKLKN
ncbi:mitochondrial antiviral-signaling protein [Trachinotus anak]|uniref:mitochondrial antiviral-signaling protein n=1 Tax=Trachinotus anak TaxID=443729 RepID=UPI0039F16FCD